MWHCRSLVDLFSDTGVGKSLIYSFHMQYTGDSSDCYLMDLLVLLGGRAITLVRAVKFTSP